MKVKLTEIKIKESRFREAMGEIEQLAVSIQRYGLLHPIVVDKELNLIAGERRLKAHEMLGLPEIEVRVIEEADSLVKREIEIEENIRRKDFTWQEEVSAKRELDRIKRELYGSAIKGHGGGWSLRDTANSLDESVGLTARDIKLAEGIEEFPELKKEKNKEAAWRRLERMREKLILEALTEKVTLKLDKECIVCGDSKVTISKLETGSVDLGLTDPPFAVDLTMKNKPQETIYEDEYAQVMDDIDFVMGEMYRVLKNNRHMYVFHTPQHTHTIVEICKRKGFQVLETPLIWYKTGGAGPAGGDMVYARNYECILFCYKGHRKLNKQGESDVITVPRVPSQRKIHPTEKPTQLLRYLIEMSTLPGELVVDPFAGSGATLIAAFQCKRNAWGSEMRKEHYADICLRIEKFIMGSEKKEEVKEKEQNE